MTVQTLVRVGADVRTLEVELVDVFHVRRVYKARYVGERGVVYFNLPPDPEPEIQTVIDKAIEALR